MDVNSSSEAIYENTQELEIGKKTKICFYPLLLSLGILSILLLASIAIITWITVDMKDHKRIHSKQLVLLEEENKHLIIEKSILENVTKQLIRERDDLKRALEVIQMYDNFPVHEFCSDKSECSALMVI
ncbi:hypothetical protein GOODEAATRI_028403 [Goodea atripinnis]|uniref:Uncharacterized protein n=1 Tax=Goodea atripinnis TaxID=208336 RepID=A0ABV0P8F9_9TELE